LSEKSDSLKLIVLLFYRDASLLLYTACPLIYSKVKQSARCGSA
jgi:hypothetical protein